MKRFFTLLFLFPSLLFAQDINKNGQKFIEKLYYTFIDEGHEELKAFYFTKDIHNEIEAIHRGDEFDDESHNAFVEELVKSSINNLKSIGSLLEKDIMLREVRPGESYDEEGIIFFEDIQAIGSDGETKYIMTIDKLIQYDPKSFYISEPLKIEMK